MNRVFDYTHENAERFREELHELLSIPSVSADPAFSGEVRRAAYWLMEHFEALGLTAELIETEGQHPMVYAEWMGAGAGASTRAMTLHALEQQ